MEEFNMTANSSGLQSIDLGEDIDYGFVVSENSDIDWESEHLEEELLPPPKRKKCRKNAALEDQGKQTIFKLKACFFAKNFKGQRNGDNVGTSTIEVKTVDEAIVALWSFSLKFIHYEAIISGSEDGTDMFNISFTETKPNLNDIDKFVMVSETISKRYFAPSLITSKLLRSWMNREINVIIYRYSQSVTTSQIWGKMKSKLFQPVSRDRAGAPSNSLLTETVRQLNDMHQEHYISDEINWTIWATYILKQPENDRSKIMSDGPPMSIVHLFRLIPSPQDEMLETCRKDLRVAKTVIDFFEDDLKSMRVAYDSLSIVVTALGSRLSTMESKVGEFRAILTSMDENVTPCENSFSRSLADEVTDCIDGDHE